MFRFPLSILGFAGRGFHIPSLSFHSAFQLRSLLRIPVSKSAKNSKSIDF